MFRLRTLALAPTWANFDPAVPAGAAGTGTRLANLVGGRWTPAGAFKPLPDPLNGKEMLQMPDTKAAELGPFVQSLAKVPKSGLHNPLKNVERYLMYGDISLKAAVALGEKTVEDHFVKLIQRTCPKSHAQALGEVVVTRKFLESYGGDQVRFLAKSFGTPGDRFGQQSNGYRWPFGPVAIVAPFNFPLEIPVLQLMGALYMGNKPVIKGASTTSVVIEEFVRLLIACGMPATDVDLIHCGGGVMEKLITSSNVRLTQFTGSEGVAEKLAVATKGKVRLEDAGFNWKLLGPDVDSFEYVVSQCDQDAYANTGQKCSAQSLLMAHKNWVAKGLYDALASRAARRKLDDLTVAPILSHTNKDITSHLEALLKIPGAKVLFGGKALTGHTIPAIYGAFEPTAVFVPLEGMLRPENFGRCTTEIFGPFQVVTEYEDKDLPRILETLERIPLHLTAAVVSNDSTFLGHVLSETVNGTTYAGIRARTTGAPQNHWFGPAGDPRGAGIGTREAIQLVWSCHREIIHDVAKANAPLPLS